MVSTFPDSDLDLLAQAAWGADLTADQSTWVWTDLDCTHPSNPAQTISRLLPTPITIRRGVTVGAATKQTTTATLHLLNHDAALTSTLETSQYWPYVDAGTPIRLRLKNQPDLVDSFTRTAVSNGWGTATSGDVWTPVTTSTAWSTSGTQGVLTVPAVNATHRISTPRVIRDIDVTWDVSVDAVATGAAHSIGFNVRYSGTGLYRLRCAAEFALSGVLNLRVRQYVNSASVSTTIANVAAPSVTYSGGTMIRVRAQVVGTNVRMRAWLASDPEPSTWPVDITQTAITGHNGALAATDVLQLQASVFASNTNTPPIIFTLDNITVAQAYSDRLEGYITDVRPEFLPQPDGTTWSTVLVDVGGVGSRLEKSQAPAFSPLRRSTQLATLTPLAYWPLEDAEGSITGASAFPGQAPMVVTGPAVFAFAQGVPEDVYQSRYGTKPLVSVAAGARLAAPVPISAVKTEWAVSLIGEFFVPDVPAVTEIRIAQWETLGATHNRWALVATDVGYQVRAYNDAAGTATTVVTDTPGSFLGQVSYTVEAIQNGADIDVQIFYNDNGGGTGSVAGTLAAVSKMMLNPDRANTTASTTTLGLKFVLGHVRVVEETSVKDLPFYTDPVTSLVVQADKGWYLETAGSRVKRLSDEERVPCTVLGDVATTGYTQLNAQRDGTFTTLVEQAAESESGMLVYEAGFGYEVLPRTARYNQTPSLVVDLATYRRSADTDQGSVLVPQLENRLSNYWTVKRHLGSEGSFAADEAYRKRRGTIVEEAVIDALTDDILEDHAAWRVHRNVDYTGAYYPSTPVDLAANPDLIDDWRDCTIGSRVQRTNQPTAAGINTIDVLVDGYTETLAPKLWSVEVAGSPAEPWQVGVYDTDLYDAATTTVGGSGIDATATSVTFSSTDVGDTWSTTPGYKVLVNGERMIVTAMGAQTGSGPWTQAATVTRSDNGVVRAHPAGTPIHVVGALRWSL